jgi:hypothetical protein
LVTGTPLATPIKNIVALVGLDVCDGGYSLDVMKGLRARLVQILLKSHEYLSNLFRLAEVGNCV